jgi:pimeloyl-ACP methyl ester carboxylesterase
MQGIKMLKQNGYYNPVSVGDYSLNVSKFGNEDGKHKIIALAGNQSGSYSVGQRHMTRILEEDNLVVFIDRAGYGFSDDTKNKMSLEYIVEDYRKALKSAGIEAPYVLMPHSIGGAYATYWACTYPEEIEAIVFVDGSQLSSDAFSERKSHGITFIDKTSVLFSKIGIKRFFVDESRIKYPSTFTSEEQKMGDTLLYLTWDSFAPISEDDIIAENAQKAFSNIKLNKIPKLYISSSWGFETREDIIKYKTPVKKESEYRDGEISSKLEFYEELRNEILIPYLNKLGNCKLKNLSGHHLIFLQRPEECGKIIKEFIESLEE